MTLICIFFNFSKYIYGVLQKVSSKYALWLTSVKWPFKFFTQTLFVERSISGSEPQHNGQNAGK